MAYGISRNAEKDWNSQNNCCREVCHAEPACREVLLPLGTPPETVFMKELYRYSGKLQS